QEKKQNSSAASQEEKQDGGGESWQKYHDDLASRLLLDKLKKARGINDLELLQMTVQDCKAGGLADHKGVAKAERQMKLIEMKTKLGTVIKERQLNAILETIDEIKKLGFDEVLMQHEVIAAKNVAEQLHRLAELKYAILNMDRRTMSEMRSYNSPPIILHNVLQAALLLLGDDEQTTKRWKTCRSCCYPDGPNGLQRKFLKFNVSKVPMELVARCKDMLDKHTVTQVQKVSAGAATFYVWARGVIDEAEKQNSSSEQVKAEKDPRKQRELLQQQATPRPLWL
ncbi:hypothetical protein LSAT2_004331, partial [Lamellibrachia satsuma]